MNRDFSFLGGNNVFKWNLANPDSSELILYTFPRTGAMETRKINGQSDIIDFLSRKPSNLVPVSNTPMSTLELDRVLKEFQEYGISEFVNINDMRNKIIFIYPLEVTENDIPPDNFAYTAYDPQQLPTYMHILAAVNTFYTRPATEEDIRRIYSSDFTSILSRHLNSLGRQYTLLDIIRGLSNSDVLFTRIRRVFESTDDYDPIQGIYEIKLGKK